MLNAKEFTNGGRQQGLTPDLLLLFGSLNLDNFLATITSTSRADMVAQLNGVALRTKFRRW